MNVLNEFKKSNCKRCSICGNEISIGSILNNNVEFSKTKRKSTVFVHKKCLGR